MKPEIAFSEDESDEEKGDNFEFYNSFKYEVY